MTNPNDFKASQVQVNKIIVTGSFANETSNQLLIYNYDAQDSGSPNQGEIDASKFDTSGVGTDVLLFVSGGIGEKDTADSNSVSVFGGDLHISGNLTVDGTYPSGGGGGGVFWTSPASDVVETTGSIQTSTNSAAGTYAVAVGVNTSASGDYSFAQGDNTTTSGVGSHAEGQYSTSDGDYSHAEGATCNSTGSYSHAEGDNTTSSGQYSHAEGSYSQSKGEASHAEGNSSIAQANYSHAEGDSTLAAAEGSHAEGYYTIASGSYSHAAGFYTISSGSYQSVIGEFNKRGNNFSLFVIGDGANDDDANRSDILRVNKGTQIGSGSVQVTGSFSATLGISGSLTRLTDGTSYLRAGSNITITFFWTSPASDVVETTGSIQTSTNSAAGTYAVAVGESTNASGPSSFSQGYKTHASGDYSHSEGWLSTGSGNYSHAEGVLTTAGGIYSHAEGELSYTDAYGSHAEGYSSYTTGLYSHAEGWETEAAGEYSHAEGYFTLAGPTAHGSHAEGSYTKADGKYSHAEGYGTLAGNSDDGFFSFPFKPHYAHAEGFLTTASAAFSHAEGSGTIACGRGAHAGGIFTIASGTGQTVYGNYNSDILRVNSGSLPGEGRVEITGSLSVSGSASSLEIFGGHRLYPSIITALPHTASFTDYIIAVSASAGPGVELRPFEYGRTFVVKDVSGSAAADNITVTAEGGELIDGASSYVLSINRGSATFVYFGPTTGWGVI
ncbi:MAG: hypothetical protein EBZ49_01380 [Proteobacteria bacterium]|nr:hypothetical protein [Pseudomonadota bacterium]